MGHVHPPYACWRDPPKSSAILETWLFAEILKSYWHNGLDAPFYFYRDRDQREIDLLIERDGRLHPVEFKKTATPTRSAARHFGAMREFGDMAGDGAVVCLRESALRLSENALAIPAAWL